MLPTAPGFMKRILTSLNLAKSEERALQNSFSGKQLCNFSKEDGEELCGHLRHIAQFMCGIQQALDIKALAYINRMLFRYYGRLTLADITDAFEMRSAGQLGTIEHYGTFSSDFVGAVLKRYSAMRHHALKVYAQQANRHKQLEVTKTPVSNQQVYDMLLTWVKAQHKLPPVWLWDAAHQHLLSIKALSLPAAGLTYEQKQKAVVAHLLRLFPEIGNEK